MMLKDSLSVSLTTPGNWALRPTQDNEVLLNLGMIVAIIGMGPAGLTLALALAARPAVRVVLFDQQQSHAEVATYNPVS